MELELCSYSVEAVRRACEAGLTRVELCAEPALDGISPSDETLRAAVAIARGASAGPGSRGVEVSVMVRPRGGGFVYSDAEFEQMRREIFRARELGADGVVVGLLTGDGDVDIVRLRELVEAARPLETTFHRAFDVARDWRAALEAIVEAGCTRLLTSGQAPTAIEGVDTLRGIIAAAHEGAAKARGRIEIMAGAGVDPTNAAALINAGVDALHFSARRDGHFADPEFIKEMTKI